MLRVKDDPNKSVPLKGVNIKGIIRSFGCDVSISQVFRNDEKASIEAVYCFPIEEHAAVYAFMARIDDREIIGQLKEKKKAQNEYNESLQQGHGSYLLEQDQKSQDNFIINVGALPPGKECEIILSYVSELELVENGTKIRFVIPTTIAPRYNPDKGGITSPASTNSKYVQSSPYTIDFRCQVSKIGVSRVSSLSHPIEIDLSQEDIYIITFSQAKTHLDRDILLNIELNENRSNTILAVEPGAVMCSFSPSEEDCQRVIDKIEVTNEFIFVVDCSGSMEDENKIGLARQSMLLFLKSLPINCQFNIVRFGSQHETLFEQITDIYNEENTRQAEQLIKNIKANLGGTELLSPFQWLEQNPPIEGRARQIFLLTDGEISNVNQVVDLCRTMANSTRIFSFGLGRSPSRSLVKGLARATNGRFVFIPPDTNVDVYVGEQLERALQPCITNVQVKWNLGTAVTTSIPTKIPPIYLNDRLIVYALMEDKLTQFDHDSSVQLKTGKHRLGEAAKVTRIPNTDNNEMIARLAAKALILELQHSKLPPSAQKKNTGSLQTRFNNEDEITKRIIELSIKYNILSPHTAFIGIEKRINGNNKDMILLEVPIQISADDQHLQATTQMSTRCAYSMRQSDSRTDTNSSVNYYCAPARPAKACAGTPKYNYHDDEENEGADGVDLFGDHDTSVDKKLKEDKLPTNNEDIVRYLIDKQKFDGTWDLNSNIIDRLTGKPFSVFDQSLTNEILISSIIISVLETRFASFSSMWYGIVQKARKRLVDLLGKDINKLNNLLKHIQKQL